LSTIVLNGFKKIQTKTTATKVAKIAYTNDSPKNERIKEPLPAPITFRMLTSLALFSERAVERFIKLMQAINKTTQAIKLNKRKYLILPSCSFPDLSKLLYIFKRVIG